MKEHLGRLLPPKGLRDRVGSLPSGMNQEEAYLELGRVVQQSIEKILPDDWEWQDKSILDFGCGAGRTLRHFLPESKKSEFWGEKIDIRVKTKTTHFKPDLSPKK